MRHQNDSVEELLAKIDQFEKCFVRIARAVGLSCPSDFIALVRNDDESYAEILARHIEEMFGRKG